MSKENVAIVAPYGNVTDVRNAGGDALGDGVKLYGGGVGWALVASDSLRQDVKDAGAEVYPRSLDDTLSDILNENGYSREEK